MDKDNDLPYNDLPWFKRTFEQQREWNIARIRRDYPIMLFYKPSRPSFWERLKWAFLG